MAITTVDGIFNALANNSSRVVIEKPTMANTPTGTMASWWRTTGQPGQGAIPTTAAVCTKALAGAIAFDNQTAPATSYFAWALLASSASGQSAELHDRIAHVGGGNFTLLTSQTNVAIDLLTLAPPAERLGASNYSDGQWFFDVYGDSGATASNATIDVTYHDGTTGNLNVLAVGGTLRGNRVIPLTPLIPTAAQGKFIRGINSVILSASTGAAGNFGFTYRRQRTGVTLIAASTGYAFDWAALGAPEVPNDSCLEFVGTAVSTAMGTLRGQAKIAHG